MSLKEKDLSDQISKTLAYLKSKKITQYEVESRLNYTSLSKAKNFEKYPQTVIEKKTRQELIEELHSVYNLVYDQNKDEILPVDEKTPLATGENEMTYIMYYYAFSRTTIGKAIVRILNQKKVTIEYPLNEFWSGNYEVIENYTFISVTKRGDTTPVKMLICLFSGTEKYGRPILMGSYSTVKRDGYPAAGSLVLELAKKNLDIHKRLKEHVDPRIFYYLKDNVIVIDTFTPNTLDTLNKDFHLVGKYANKFKVYYSRHGKIRECNLELFDTGDALIEMISITYTGIFRLLDSHTLKVVLRDKSDFSLPVKEEIDLVIRTNSSLYSPFYFGSGLTNLFESEPFHFKCLVINNQNVTSDTIKKAKKLLN